MKDPGTKALVILLAALIALGLLGAAHDREKAGSPSAPAPASTK